MTGNFFATVLFILVIAFLLVVGGIFGYHDGYKKGQIDALTDHASYCLNDKYEWVYGKPGDELRCSEAK